MNLIGIIQMRFSACLYYTKRSSIHTIIMHSESTYSSYFLALLLMRKLRIVIIIQTLFVVKDKDNCQTKIQFFFHLILFDFFVKAFMHWVKVCMRK